MPAEDDILLLQLIKQDDEKAFKHLFDTYFVLSSTYKCNFLGADNKQ